MQYTIRSVSPPLDKALRALAQKTGKSLNATALEALAKGIGINNSPTVHHDLDWFIGSKGLGKEFDEAMEWHKNLPNDIFDEPFTRS